MSRWLRERCYASIGQFTIVSYPTIAIALSCLDPFQSRLARWSVRS